MYVSVRLVTMICLESCSFTVRGMRILLQKLHIYITFANTKIQRQTHAHSDKTCKVQLGDDWNLQYAKKLRIPEKICTRSPRHE